MPKSYPTSIRMTDELKADLTKIAEARRWTVAATVINALKEWCAFQIQQMPGKGKKK